MAEASALGALSTDRQELLRRLLEKKGVQASRVERIPRRSDPSAPAPLSFAQQRLWLLDRLEPGTALYNVPAAVRVPGEISPEALRLALADLVRRHESLRTTFVEHGGEPLQIVGSPFVPPLSLYDVSALPEERRMAEAARLVERESRQPFDLARGPLVRAVLVRLAPYDAVVAVTLHHIVSDGWSSLVLVRELMELGVGHALGQPSVLPELPIQYADFAVWQRGHLTGETLEKQLEFWRRSLAGIPESLELPFDRPRPVTPSGRGGRRRLSLGGEGTARLKDLAGREGATLFAVLLAGFGALLGRLADQAELAVGTVTANRNREEVEGLIGFFVNTLTLPVRLVGDPPFSELVQRAKETVHEAFAHQDVPFERLVEELAPDRTAGRNPLFQVAFAFQNLSALRSAEDSLDLLPVETGTAKFDLSLSLGEVDGVLAGELEYAADLFDPTTAERYGGYLVSLLAAAAVRPETALSALPLLGETERYQLVIGWNDTAVEPGEEVSIPAAVGVQVRSVPDRVAVVAGEAQLSYGELGDRAGRLAHELRGQGVEPEVTVGVCLERSLELVIALLGILEAGGAYVPLDLDYPEARLAFMLEAARGRVVITEERFAERPVFAGLARASSSLLSSMSLTVLAAGPPAPAPSPALALVGANLAYVPFTSGSTGQPKGVAITHRGALRLIREGGYAHFGPGERFLLVSPISFDPSTAEIWGALAHGARLALLPQGIPSLDLLAGELARHGITTLWLSAGLFHEVVDGRLEMLAGVRQLMAGGEALSPAHVLRAAAALPGLRLIDSYGPTEVTTFTTCFTVDPRAVAHTVPIGRPIGNTRVHVLDRTLAPVPIGVPGELLAGGEGLARGYIGRPDLTAERFVPDPVSGLPGERLYRTGDRVRVTAGGLFEFLGRFDDQVKVRGFRIEPSEVEAVLAGCAGVAQAAVLATPPKPGESRRLVAFVARAEGAALDPAGLAAWLGARLPDYMVPGSFVITGSLPIAPTGKVDRRALLGRLAGAVTERESPAAFVPPRTPTEELMAAVWSEVLGVERVGAGDDFFALGGHSLLATRAAARVRDVFGVELPLRHFFEAEDLADLAARLDRLRGSGAALDFPPITPRPEGEPAPLSFAQERLWFLDRLTPDSAIYNVPEVERFAGPLSADLLGRSLAAIVERHEILRSRFAAGEGGRPVQIVDPLPESLLALVDLAALPAARAEGEMQRWSWHEAFRPFDLRRSPLLRATLFRLASEDHAWVVVRHHIATDGWSAEIFRRELMAFYGALAAGEGAAAAGLPELPVQYADFAAWQRRHLSPAILEGQLAYWRDQLAGAPPLLDLPADRPRPPEQQFAGAIRSRALPDELAASLLALGRRFGATRYMVLLAAWKALLARYTGRTDLLVGTPVANRRRAEVQELIGFFANTLVLRTDLEGDPSFSELLLRVRGTALAAYDHQDLPFERLVEELNPVRDPSYPALAQVLFVQQGRNRREVGREGGGGAAGFSRVEGDRALSRFDVELYVFEVGEGLELALEYRVDLFDAPRMVRLLGHLETLLAAASADPGLRLSELPLLSPAEHQQLLAEWGEGVWDEVFGGPFLHDLFAEQARLVPGAPALVAVAGGETVRWSYAELDEASDRLAVELHGRGIGRGDRVGILTRRNAGLIAGLLGILKAGAAYVPLDPAYPEPRLRRIATDAELAALLVGEGGTGILGEVSVPRLFLTVALSPVPSPETGEGNAWEGVLPRLLPRTYGGGGEEKASSAPNASVVLDTSAGSPSPVSGEGTGERATVAPDDLAYLIYTSGSTGTPKGVAIRHGSAAALVRWTLGAFSRAELSRVLAATSVNFDLSVFEIFVPLAVGGTVVLVEDALSLPGLTEEVTLLNTVPSVLAEVLKGRLPAAPAAGWTVNLAGEPLRRELADPILAIPGVRRLWNLYGPSEDTTYSTGTTVPAGTSEEPSIGRAVAGTRAVLLDAFGAPAPVGVPGELCLGGAGLARGYWRRADLTAERFVPDPTPVRAGERLYRTGDLARWAASGELQFLGRIDHQVKVRGFRIELSEIEIALGSHPDVAQAAVLALGDGADRRLVACVSPAAVSPAELRAYLREGLPDYMVPGSFLALAALPLSPNGKVDRKALAALAGAVSGEALAADLSGHRPPEGPIEIGVAGIWSDLLHRPGISRDDNFFDLGGHSLQGVRLLSRLHETFGVELALRTLFEAPTLTGLAARIEQALAEQAGGETRTRQPIPRLTDRNGPLPLSFSQERLWFLEQLEPGTPFYNIPAALRFAGSFEPALLEAAVGDLLARHEALRTRFGDEDGRPYQKIGEPEPLPVPVIDLSGLPPGVRPHELGRQVGEESRRPFDLVRGPLLRVVVIKVAPEDQVVAHTVHHIVSDGWSSGILMREIGLFYGARVAGLPASLPPLPIQYADYAAWQRQVLSGDSLARLLAYWRGRLAGCRGLELPLDRPRPAVETFRGANRTVVLAPERARPVAELARRSGATLFMVLLSAFKATLFRSTGQADVPVGSPIANRSRRELEGVVGFFANTLVLRTDLSGEPTFAELLARVKEVTLGGYAHEDLPFERLVEEVQPERDMSRNPLFQVMLVLQNQPREGTAGEAVATTAMPVDSGTAKFDLTIFWSEVGEALVGLLEHNSDLFDASTALRFYTHYENLMAAATAHPETRLSDLDLLSAAERHQVAAEWNATRVARPLVPVHLLVAERARQAPSEVAAVYGGRTLTYGELEERANRMAHGLRKLGVEPEARVGVSLERSLSMVIAALAVQKAGGALVALDTAYPVERLARIIDDAGLTLLLTDETQLARFPGHERIALLLDDGREPFPDAPATPPAVVLDLDHPMYVIYTSGTTGSPKGIAVPHRAFANLLGWQLASAPIAPGTRTVQFAAFGFCVSFQEIFTSWVSGGTLVVAAERVRRDVEELGGFLGEEKVERLHLPFAALKALSEGTTGVASGELDSPKDPRDSKDGKDERRRDGRIGGLPSSITEVITAGEPLRVTPAVRALFGAGDRASLANQYGASETHVVAAEVLTGDPALWPAIPPVGRPIENVRIYLLDPQLSPVARLVRGELYAGGDCLPRCYLNDPALTAAKLVPDPFGEPGGRLYRTGDAARYLADGRIEHLGRLDSQVKVRGFRVELGEVDTALARHPAVRDCAVVAVPGPEGSRLVAYVVAEEGEAPETEALRAHLKEILPDYMVPAAFVALPALPVNANGKLDQGALPAPDFTRRASGPYASPEGPVAEVVAAIWGEVLGLARVSAEDDFFDLGGHSLLATQVVSRLRAAFSVDLPVRALFEAPTVTALAKRVEERMRQVAGLASLPLTAMPRTGPPPLSFAQERLWFLDRLEGGGSATYNMPIAVRFVGPLSVPVLTRALGEIVRRHEALRTVFAPSPDGPVQIVRRAGTLAVPRLDLTALPPERRGAELGLQITAESRRPFDLARGPLFRPVLFDLGTGDHALSANTHHIVSDGWSLGVLLSELTALYAAFAAGRPSPLPPLPIQYGDFALWQRRWLSGDLLASEVEHWRTKLAPLNLVLEVPADRPRPPVKTTVGAIRDVWLDGDLTAGLKRVARSNGATLFMALLTAFETLLYRLTGEPRFALGTPIANRNRLETEGLIGFFVNTLVLAADLAGEPSFAAAVARAREETLAAYAHQDLPFEKIVEEVKPPRSLAHTPIFQVLFVLQNQDTTKALSPRGEMAPGLVLDTLAAESGTAKFDLTLSLAETAPGLAGGLEYATDLFDAPTIDRYVRALATLTRAAADHPETPLSHLPLLAPEEEAQLLREWNDTAGDFPGQGLLFDRIEAQARRTPGAIALAQGSRTLTYADLFGETARVAYRLAALGAGPETRIGVLADRSHETILALLAIWQAGAAYVPLDPEAPARRLEQIVDLADLDLLLAAPSLFSLVPPDLPFFHLDATPVEEAAEGGAASPKPRNGAGGTAGAPPHQPEAPWSERRRGGTALGSPVPQATDVPRVGGPSPQNLAYLLFTSGSTGEPKGVQISHGAIANRVLWTLSRHPLTPEDRVLLKTPLVFDASVWEWAAPLAAGARLALASPGEHRDPASLVARAAAEGITVLQAVPSLLALLPDEPGFAALTGLRLLFAGGEALEAPLVTRLLATTRADVVNLYGPTEVAIDACSRAYPQGWEGGPVTLGRPIANDRVYLLDDRFFPVPVGVEGELTVGGAGLARGYTGRPDLTAERFVPDPFGASGDRLYRTGDLARATPRGEILYRGRRDQQVKVRGVRIELAEIELALAAHPDVRAAAAWVDRSQGHDPRLLAAAVLAEGREGGVPEPALRGFLAARLPAALVPAQVAVLPELPRTAGGKLDRQALSALVAGAGPAPFEPPRTAVEQLLASLWGGVLDLPCIGRGDDFFAAGGHSLLATRVLSRLRAALGVEIPLRDLFEEPTLGGFALRVEQALARRSGEAAPPLVPVVRTGGGLPLSFAQERLWFLDQMQPGLPLYNMPAAHRLTGELSVPHLEGALTALAARHETLRTVFVSEGGTPLQIVRPAAPVPLPVIDLRGLPAGRRAAATGTLAADEAGRPFDLARGPVLRAILLELAPADRILLLTMHHIVSDAWSMDVLVRELTALYAALAEGRPAALPPLPVQYADFATWQRGWLAGPNLEREVEAWRERLAGLPPWLDLPTDRPRPAVQTARGNAVPMTLPGRAAALGELARRVGATPFMVLLAAWVALLARLSGQGDLAVGSPVAGRNRLETEGLIGFFVNTLVLRARPAEGSFRDLLGRVREAALFAYAHQDLPFEKLVEELNPPRSLARSPLFQVLFSFEVGGGEPPAGGPVPAPLPAGGARTAKYDLTVVLREAGEGIAGVAEYAADLFDPTTVARWLAGFTTLVEGALTDPERELTDLPLLGEVELHQLSRELSDTAATFPAGAAIPEVFAAVAARFPERPAVEYPGTALTYRELGRRAGSLAGRLAGAGVGPEVPVALLLPRSAEMVVASLAVLEAGGAYVPLDPTFPRERLAWQIADCGAAVAVVTPELLPLWEALAPAGARTLTLQGDGTLLPGAPASSLAEPPAEAPARVCLGGDALAYLMYTSGSTGRPKGVAISHRGVLRLVLGSNYLGSLGPPAELARPGGRIAQVANPIFDGVTFEIWGALLNGGTVVGIEREVTVSPADFAAEIVGRAIDVMFLTTALFHQVADHEPAAFAGVRELLVGGEALDPEPLKRVLASRPPRSFANVYGPTENTTFSSWRPVRSAEGVPANVPIGRPIANSTLYVVDTNLVLTLQGVIGELALGGSGLARGYQGRPDLTAERFVPDPWGPPGARLYKTGDRARHLGSGEIEFLGRFDAQVKLRGFRIELAEIEATLLEHPAVRQAAVLVREDRPGDRRLVAYVSGSTGEALEAPALHAFLAERLPAYMLPAAFVTTGSLPLSATGKIDRRALPAPEGGERAAATVYVEPETVRERAIAAALCEVLAIDRAGREDNFFDLGAHSLLLVKLASRLTERLERPVTVIDLFRFPSIAALADHLGSEEPAGIDREVHEQRAVSRRRSLAERRDRRRVVEKGAEEEDEEWR